MMMAKAKMAKPPVAIRSIWCVTGQVRFACGLLMPAAESPENRNPASISTRKKTFRVVSLNWIAVSEATCRREAPVENAGCRMGKGKLRIGERQEDRADAQPERAIRKQNPLQGD